VSRIANVIASLLYFKACLSCAVKKNLTNTNLYSWPYPTHEAGSWP